tara:strand:+ start:771 stop:1793 length:1023 start_codon:yes stop_codon:yes gene_type:complete
MVTQTRFTRKAILVNPNGYLKQLIDESIPRLEAAGYFIFPGYSQVRVWISNKELLKTSSAGYYDSFTFRITIKEKVIQVGHMKDIRDLFLHEYAHHLVNIIYPHAKRDHGKEFKKICKILKMSRRGLSISYSSHSAEYDPWRIARLEREQQLPKKKRIVLKLGDWGIAKEGIAVRFWDYGADEESASGSLIQVPQYNVHAPAGYTFGKCQRSELVGLMDESEATIAPACCKKGNPHEDTEYTSHVIGTPYYGAYGRVGIKDVRHAAKDLKRCIDSGWSEETCVWSREQVENAHKLDLTKLTPIDFTSRKDMALTGTEGIVHENKHYWWSFDEEKFIKNWS